ncbi:MAG: endonuclease domain-containing protein [Candidatus Competibacteraceae bacterium]|nr:endonuclease domain-containing protein [Candidatus Competibacteraceae bacterium]
MTQSHLTERARELRSNMTNAERHLWKHLRQRQIAGYRFRRQMPMGSYIVDFICLERRLIIEIDGSQHQEQQVYDARRDQWLAEQEFQVLRFWNNEVLNQTEGVLMRILEVLERTPHPSPSRKEEGAVAELRSWEYDLAQLLTRRTHHTRWWANSDWTVWITTPSI